MTFGWTINEDYLYEDLNGLDWNEIRVEYQQRIEAGLTDDEFYAAMDEVVMRLGDDHSVFLSPDQVSEEDDEFQGKYDYVGIGVMLSAVPDRQRAVIIVTFPGSPAEAAGLQPREQPPGRGRRANPGRGGILERYRARAGGLCGDPHGPNPRASAAPGNSQAPADHLFAARPLPEFLLLQKGSASATSC